MRKFSIFILIITLFTCSEDPVRSNPYDPDYDPAEWMPQNLQLDQQNIHTIDLEWDQVIDQIDGFKIEKKAGDNDWQEVEVLDKETMEYNDTSAVPGVENSYRVSAYAGENESEDLSKNIEAEFPAPSELSLTQKSLTEIELKWQDNSEGEDGFKIDRKVESGDWQEVISLNENKTTWNDTTINLDQNYYYRVYAYKDEQSSSKIEKEIAAGFPAPTDLSAIPLDDNTIKLTWVDNCSFEESYKIERKDSGGTFTQIKQVSHNTTEYTDYELTYGKSYQYRVRANFEAYNSEYSNETNKVTLIIQHPSNLTANAIDDQSISLSWIDNCDFESGYKIERKKSGGAYTEIEQLSANTTEYIDQNLDYEATYYYRVRANTENNNSDYSAERSATTKTIQKPTNLTANAIDDQSINLSWTDNCDFESGYKIERKKSGGTYTEIEQLSANTTEYTDQNLDYEANYYYRVRANTEKNNSDYSEERSATTKTIQEPTNLTASVVDDQSIKLTWSDNCEFESGCKVERKKSGGTFSEIADLSANTNQYTDQGLSQDIEYTYRVRAYTAQNYSEYSNLSSAKIVPIPDYMVEVQGGTYTMGDIWGGGDSDETLTHEVTVSSFYMSKYEVTHADYIEFLNSRGVSGGGSYNGNELIDMDDGDCAVAHDGSSFYFDGSSRASDEQCPVIEVTWYGAAEYCNWLSEQEGLTKAYTISSGSVSCDWNADGYRLPTEAEWEYAARSGGRDDRKWSGTNSESELGDYAWYDPNSGGETHPVGQKQPNDLGIYEMSGNVWEWCWDWYDSYSSSSQTDPTGPASGSLRVRRGGGYDRSALYCRTSNRSRDYPSGSSNRGLGFRLTRSQ